MENVLLIKEVDPEKIVIGAIEDRRVTIFYRFGESVKPLRINTPRLKVPFDLDEVKAKDGRVFIKNLTISTEDHGSSKNLRDLKRFREKIGEIDKKIVSLLPENLQMKTFYNSLYQKDEKYQPTMKLGILMDREENAKIPIFDNEQKVINEEFLKKGVVVSAIITLDQLWMNADKMGLNWTVNQIQIREDQPKLKIMLRD